MARQKVVLECKDGTRTKESFKDQTDVNKIVARYKKTGLLPQVPGGRYGDFSELGTYHEVMEKVIASQELFMSLPSALRARFQNDVGAFLSFVDDPQNKNELIELGLMQDSTPSQTAVNEGGASSPANPADAGKVEAKAQV